MSHYPRAQFLISADAPAGFGDDSGAEVAFAGRSNSGKSSAINAIVQRRDLARTSKTPGRTQLVNFFELDPGRRLVDLPGYGYAQVPPSMRAHWGRLMQAYFTTRESLAGLFIIVDARRGFADSDQLMLDYASARNSPVHVLLSKADKLGRNEGRELLKRTRTLLADRATAQLFSAVTGAEVDAARGALDAMLARRPLRNSPPGGGG
ncbi:MAG: ribosome biogenesis GTP-binding protein YihA/YsxC [Steroidobacteraceae bacterium]